MLEVAVGGQAVRYLVLSVGPAVGTGTTVPQQEGAVVGAAATIGQVVHGISVSAGCGVRVTAPAQHCSVACGSCVAVPQSGQPLQLA